MLDLLRHKKKASQREAPQGGDEWIRTTDSRIFSPMLYHLSYITALKWGKISHFYNSGKILNN